MKCQILIDLTLFYPRQELFYLLYIELILLIKVLEKSIMQHVVDSIDAHIEGAITR